MSAPEFAPVRATTRTEPTVSVLPFSTNALTVSVRNARVRTRSTDDESRWSQMCARNPALFDGQIYSVERVGQPAPGMVHIDVYAEKYSTLCLDRDRCAETRTDPGGAPTPACEILSVTGLLLRPSTTDHTQHDVLLGLRSSDVASYPMHWEFGPAGGVNVPERDAHEITLDDLRRTLIAEYAEEIGHNADSSRSQVIQRALECALPVCLAHDAIASSFDIALCAVLPIDALDGHPLLGQSLVPSDMRNSSTEHWEYSALAWVPTHAIGDWVAESEHKCIPPTAAIARSFGWSA